MKRYITTEKHEVLPSGLEFEQSEMYDRLHLNSKTGIYIHNDDIDLDVANGWLKEIQDPKWTDDDLKNLLEDYSTGNEHLGKNIDYYVSIWIKRQNK